MERNQGTPDQSTNPVVAALEQTEPVQPTPAPAQAAPAPKKKNSTMVLVITLLLLVAAGGVGFGVWAMMDKNEQTNKLNKQIQDLRNGTSSATLDPDNPSGGDTRLWHENHVIKSSDSSTEYRIGFSSSNMSRVYNGEKHLRISVKEGVIESCDVVDTVTTGPGEMDYNSQDCSISGLEGNIYKIVEFGAGQDSVYNSVGFIMTDGTVKYLPLHDSVDNNNFAIRGSLNIDGYVTDAFWIQVGDETGTGYGSTVFILNDGTYVVYNESMLQ